MLYLVILTEYCIFTLTFFFLCYCEKDKLSFPNPLCQFKVFEQFEFISLPILATWFQEMEMENWISGTGRPPNSTVDLKLTIKCV